MKITRRGFTFGAIASLLGLGALKAARDAVNPMAGWRVISEDVESTYGIDPPKYIVKERYSFGVVDPEGYTQKLGEPLSFGVKQYVEQHRIKI